MLAVTPFGTSSVTGGAEKWLLGMITNTPAFSWHVLSLQDGPFCDELRAAGVGVTVRPTGSSAAAVGKRSVATARLLERMRPDVVIGNGVKAQLVVALATPLRAVPTVWVKHDYSYDSLLAGPLGWAADSVIATAAEVGVSAGRTDLTVIHPPVQNERIYDREAARSILSAQGLAFDDRPIVAMAGRLVSYKGFDDAVAALNSPDAEAWRLIIIGDEDHSSVGERERLSRLAEELGVSGRVTFTPPVSGLGRLFAAFDALAVLTKPTDRRAPAREGFGMTAFEAMQAAIPVIAVEGSPVADRLEESAGIIVSPQAPEEVAVALGRLSDPGLRERMGQCGRAIVADYADVAETAVSFTDVLLEVARQGHIRGLCQRALRAFHKIFRFQETD